MPRTLTCLSHYIRSIKRDMKSILLATTAMHATVWPKVGYGHPIASSTRRSELHFGHGIPTTGRSQLREVRPYLSRSRYCRLVYSSRQVRHSGLISRATMPIIIRYLHISEPLSEASIWSIAAEGLILNSLFLGWSSHKTGTPNLPKKAVFFNPFYNFKKAVPVYWLLVDIIIIVSTQIHFYPLNPHLCFGFPDVILSLVNTTVPDQYSVH